MDVKSTKLDSQQEKIISLKMFILNAPAPASEHHRQLGNLTAIMQGYSDEIIAIRKELEQLKQQHNGQKKQKTG